jgi:hypothetical protein
MVLSGICAKATESLFIYFFTFFYLVCCWIDIGLSDDTLLVVFGAFIYFVFKG